MCYSVSIQLIKEQTTQFIMAQSPGAKMLKKAMSLKTELRDKIIKRHPSSATSSHSSSLDGSFSKQHQYNTPVKKPVYTDRLEAGVAKVKQALQYARDVVQKKTFVMLPGVATVVLETVQELLQTLHYYYHTANSDEYSTQCTDLYRATAELTRLSDTSVLHAEQIVDSDQILGTIQTIQENIALLTSQCVEKSDGIPAVTPTSDRSSDASTSFLDVSNVSSDGDVSMSSESVNASPPPTKPPLPHDYEVQLSKVIPLSRDSSPHPPPLPQKQSSRSRSATENNSVYNDNKNNCLKPSPLQISYDDSDLNQNRMMVPSPSWPASRNSREPSPMDILERMREEMRSDIGTTLSSIRSSSSCHRMMTFGNQQSIDMFHESSQFSQQRISDTADSPSQQIALRQNHVDGLTTQDMVNQAASSFSNQLALASPSPMSSSSVQCYSFKKQVTKSKDGVEQSESQSTSHIVTRMGRADVNASFVQSYVNDFAGKKQAYAFKVDVEGEGIGPDERNFGKVTVTSKDLTDNMGAQNAIEYVESPPPLPLKKKQVDIYMLAFGDAPSTMLDFAQSHTHFQDFYRERFQQQQSELALYNNAHSYDNTSESDEYPEEPPPKPALPEPESDPTYEPIPENTEEESETNEIILATEVLPYITRNEEDTMEFVKAGCVDALVSLAACAGNREFLYQEAFLTTYLTFIHAGDLIDKLLRRYSHFSSSEAPHSKRFSRSTFSLLIRVVDEMGALVGEEVLDDLFYLVFCLISDGELILAKCLRKTLLNKCEMRQKLLEAKRNIALLPSIQLTMRNITLLDLKAHVIAEQMTLIDNELFQSIEISELLRYSREQREELSPNLTKFTEHFNRVSFWCRSRIMEKDDPKEREKFMIKFHKIMKHLRKLKNFNSYLALLAAVDCAPVRRLDWAKHLQESLTELSDIIDSSSSFRKYRNTLAETQPPCIPYIGLILQDLTFVHIGNPDKVDSGDINFSKRWQLFHLLEGLRRYKKQSFEIKKDSNVIMFFNGFGDHLSEEVLWQLSEDYKPRKTSKSTS